MHKQTDHAVDEKLNRIGALAPAGYALALQVRFTSTTFLLMTYPDAWQEYYNSNSLVLEDQTVKWAFTHEGIERWSNLDDRTNVIGRAAEYGLKFGIVCAVEIEGKRSFGCYARSDRDFADSETAELLALTGDMHVATSDEKIIDPIDMAAIQSRVPGHA